MLEASRLSRPRRPVNQLVKRFGLSGVVFFGHCAGAVSALYAGAASSDCKGLILLDPYFHVPLGWSDPGCGSG
jgi:pimeloyl-ACP methyl ester carboxylesterase